MRLSLFLLNEHDVDDGVNTPNFRTTPPASYLDNPRNISQGVLNIIITFANMNNI